MKNIKKSVVKGKDLRAQLAKYKAQFSKELNVNSSNSGIGFGQVRKELESILVKRLGQSPNFMSRPLGQVVTTDSGFKYVPLFKRRKHA